MESHRENICCVCDTFPPASGNQMSFHREIALHSLTLIWGLLQLRKERIKKGNLSEKNEKRKQFFAFQKTETETYSSHYHVMQQFCPILMKLDHSIERPTQTKPSEFWCTVHPWHTNEFNSDVAKQEVRTFLINGVTYSDQTYFLDEGTYFQDLRYTKSFWLNSPLGGAIVYKTVQQLIHFDSSFSECSRCNIFTD